MRPDPDPTGTHKLRTMFRAVAKSRVRKLWRDLRTMLLTHDALGLKQGKALPRQIAPGTRLQVLDEWLAMNITTTVFGDGRWLDANLQNAYNSGLKAGAELLKQKPPYAAFDPVYHTMALQELKGIMAALSQNVTRAATAGLREHIKPADMWRNVDAAFARIAEPRVDALCNMFTVQLHNRGRLDVFRSAGLEKVGIVPEHILTLRRATHDHQHKDAELVNVLTAGDDKVCQQCEDIAEDGPYEIDEAETLIPAHPNCRCAFVPAFDRRFATNRELEFSAT